jgi:uncharacterized damage-inducible protein DinB
MSDIRFLHEQLLKGYSGDPWHGPATAGLLEDLSATEAAARPIPGAHSIWELVLHMTAWHGEVRRRLHGGTPDLPEEGDWPEIREVNDIAWLRDRERLGTSINQILDTLAGLAEQDLDRPGGSISDQSITHRAMVHGLVQHLAYHSGQIMLLRKALRSGTES